MYGNESIENKNTKRNEIFPFLMTCTIFPFICNFFGWMWVALLRRPVIAHRFAASVSTLAFLSSASSSPSSSASRAPPSHAMAEPRPCVTCRQYPQPSLAVDAGVLRKESGQLQVLLIQRGAEPFKVTLIFFPSPSFSFLFLFVFLNF